MKQQPSSIKCCFLFSLIGLTMPINVHIQKKVMYSCRIVFFLKKLKRQTFFKNKNEANCYIEELCLVPQLNPIFLLLLSWRRTNTFMKAEGSMIEGHFPAASFSLLFIPITLLSFLINRAQHKKAPQN